MLNGCAQLLSYTACRYCKSLTFCSRYSQAWEPRPCCLNMRSEDSLKWTPVFQGPVSQWQGNPTFQMRILHHCSFWYHQDSPIYTRSLLHCIQYVAHHYSIIKTPFNVGAGATKTVPFTPEIHSYTAPFNKYSLFMSQQTKAVALLLKYSNGTISMACNNEELTARYPSTFM